MVRGDPNSPQGASSPEGTGSPRGDVLGNGGSVSFFDYARRIGDAPDPVASGTDLPEVQSGTSFGMFGWTDSSGAVDGTDVFTPGSGYVSKTSSGVASGGRRTCNYGGIIMIGPGKNTSSGRCDRYDIQNDTFISTTNCPADIAESPLMYDGTYIYVGALFSFQRYDPANDSWSQVGSGVTTSYANYPGWYQNGYCYVFDKDTAYRVDIDNYGGGSSYQSGHPDRVNCAWSYKNGILYRFGGGSNSGTADKWDPLNKTITSITNPPYDIEKSAFCGWDRSTGKIVVSGIADSSGSPTTRSFTYDPSTDTYDTSISSPPTARHSTQMSPINN